MILYRSAPRIFLLPLFAFLFSVLARAQTPNLTVHFSAIVLGDKAVSDLYFLSTGGKLAPLKAPSYKRSGDFTYVGPTVMTLYRMGQKDGVAQPEEVGSAQLPAGGGKILLIMIPAGTNYTLGAVDDSEALLPLGKTRIYNATPNPLQVLCNSTQKVPLKPFQTATVDSKDGGIVVNVSMQKEGEWQEVSNNVYNIPKDQKLNLFLVSSYSKSVFKSDVQMFRLMEGNVPAPRAATTGTKNKTPAANGAGAAGG